MNKNRFVRFWSLAVGSMDAVTGLLLIFFPNLVTKMLGVSLPSEATVFLSWIGVFVLSVGLSYGFALGRRGWGEVVWIFTALVRTLVAVFLVVKILDGSLVPAWAIVGISDGLVGIVQIAILRAGWWKEVAE